jgi:hypothetical protein
MKRRWRRPVARLAGLALVVGAACVNLGWTRPTVRHVAWSAVAFFPPDLARQVRRHHRRFDAGIARGLEAPPAWRAGHPGRLEQALQSQLAVCVEGLQRPIPLDDLVEELGVLAVRVLDANDPLAVSHADPREPSYSEGYSRYVDSILVRVRLVYYGKEWSDVQEGLRTTFERSRQLYPFVGDEFYRPGHLADWRTFDDRSVAFGVAAVALSRALTDLASLAAHVWSEGGGLVPPPRPTPTGHVGPTVTVALSGGFPERDRPGAGRPAMPQSPISLPPP